MSLVLPSHQALVIEIIAINTIWLIKLSEDGDIVCLTLYFSSSSGATLSTSLQASFTNDILCQVTHWYIDPIDAHSSIQLSELTTQHQKIHCPMSSVLNFLNQQSLVSKANTVYNVFSNPRKYVSNPYT